MVGVLAEDGELGVYPLEQVLLQLWVEIARPNPERQQEVLLELNQVDPQPQEARALSYDLQALLDLARFEATWERLNSVYEHLLLPSSALLA